MTRPSESSQFNLVTAASANLLSDHRLNLLMGTWCTHYNVRNPILDDDFALIAAPWGLEKRYTPIAEYAIMQISDRVLSKLVTQLNDKHQVTYTRRTWEIILGPWLKVFVGYIYRRSSTLNTVLQSHDIFSIKCFTFQASRVYARDTNDFIVKTMDPVWQSMIDSILLNVIAKKNVYLELIPAPVEEPMPFFSKKRRSISSKKVITYILSQALERAATSKFLSSLPQRYYLQATYLPIFVELRLHVVLGQFPKVRWLAGQNSQASAAVDETHRKILYERDIDQSLPMVEACINEVLIHLLPTCYLEGFENLLQSVRLAKLPRNPKVIFTSVSFETDEVFKVWTGLQTQCGTKYVVGQHGNNYGTSSNQHTTEQRTPDQFLSWGWKGDSPNTIPAFNLKSSGRKYVSAVGDGILLIQDWLPYPTYPRDTDLEFTQNLQKQFDFIASLPYEIRKVITIRLHPTHARSTFDIIGAWNGLLEIYPELTLDLGDIPIRKLIAKQALVIHCYDSTGMLETFAENIPSISYIPDGLEHLNDTARMRYDALKEAGLLYVSAKLAAEAVCQIYPNVKDWWKSEKLYTEKEIFINSYSKISNRPARELAKVLKELGRVES